MACLHEPRTKPPAVPLPCGIGSEPNDPRFDPHSGIYTFPTRGAESLAVQQFLLSRVVHVEPGKVPAKAA